MSRFQTKKDEPDIAKAVCVSTTPCDCEHPFLGELNAKRKVPPGHLSIHRPFFAQWHEELTEEEAMAFVAEAEAAGKDQAKLAVAHERYFLRPGDGASVLMWAVMSGRARA